MINFIHQNNILIVALDVPDVKSAKDVVNKLGNSIHFYKIGLELFSGPDSYRLIEWLRSKDKHVFLDLKMFDIPETVYRATRNLVNSGITYTTVHGCSQDAVDAAVSGSGGQYGILAVTVLTSHQDGVESQLATIYARNAQKVGAIGIISSGLEADHLRRSCGDDFIIVCPGIRDPKDDKADQKRIVTIEQALYNGANHLVMGRPITQANDPKQMALTYQERIIKIVDTLTV